MEAALSFCFSVMGAPNPRDLADVLFFIMWSSPINAPDAKNMMFLVSIY